MYWFITESALPRFPGGWIFSAHASLCFLLHIVEKFRFCVIALQKYNPQTSVVCFFGFEQNGDDSRHTVVLLMWHREHHCVSQSSVELLSEATDAMKTLPDLQKFFPRWWKTLQNETWMKTFRAFKTFKNEWKYLKISPIEYGEPKQGPHNQGGCDPPLLLVLVRTQTAEF